MNLTIIKVKNNLRQLSILKTDNRQRLKESKKVKNTSKRIFSSSFRTAKEIIESPVLIHSIKLLPNWMRFKDKILNFPSKSLKNLSNATSTMSMIATSK